MLVSSQHDPGTHHFDLWRVSTFDQLTQGAYFTFSELYRVVWFWSSHMASSLPKFTPSFPEHIYEMLYLELHDFCRKIFSFSFVHQSRGILSGQVLQRRGKHK
ncbi:hypothetical protein CLDAP_28390 [Caldilinea aerophila DSM 14535 = NBRC 104270]|uniref:Uncharacterized protein n=2 Tax=Caldilinea aerophila (strain DSM 14535 / JCM 11387 / NBRC 104270 / STL-6-O1) TaxID=926550 RepID=I0I6J1_CALAS|nr:hypothetical protein CLDAP_28390 [Caldilinea aerophila DSM 14535 = NBRC 104270]